MDRKLIVSNFKSFKTKSEAIYWLDEFKAVKELDIEEEKKDIVICPPFTLLELFKNYFHENNISVSLGAQNVSPFDQGAYTGEINAVQIKEFADYVLIGHSERRLNFTETDEMLSKKVELSLKYNLKPIFLVQGENTHIPDGISYVAYEPIFAIGSGTPDTPENANNVSGIIKANKDIAILYGGSVKPENVSSFTNQGNINGVLVGGASLNAQDFINIIKNA